MARFTIPIGRIAFFARCVAILAVCLPAFAAEIRVSSISGVLDANGATPLQGNGLSSATSDRVQLLYAGPDGVIQPPDAAGLPTGDDMLLTLSEFPGQTYTAIGEGFPFNPNQGKFTEDFVHNLSAGAKIYVRAWNSSSPGAGSMYGDSLLYSVTTNLGESHDFGTWIANKQIQGSLPLAGTAGAVALALLMLGLAFGRLRESP